MATRSGDASESGASDPGIPCAGAQRHAGEATYYDFADGSGNCGFGPVVYHFKEGSNPWWTAVQLRNHRNAIARFEVELEGAWVEVPRVDYNYFVAETGSDRGPCYRAYRIATAPDLNSRRPTSFKSTCRA